MIKGCQKKIIHITNTGSPYFEEAYFILRRGRDNAECKEDDMVREAMLIAKKTSDDNAPKKSKNIKRAAAVLISASFASLVFGIVMLIIVL